MRLVNSSTLDLEEFFNDIPAYAILSHTWGPDELTLQDWEKSRDDRLKKAGYMKIAWSCQQAQRDAIGYVWADTCCIDKTSSSELSEAINSMYAWYRDAKVCYAYLADMENGSESSFRSSRWFTRGWTLQELIAPSNLVFYSKDWKEFGTKLTKRTIVSAITGVDIDYLRQPSKIYDASVARRMSWMAGRTTTRVEDTAYCMLGIFDINMALLYGEGSRAFMRLQEEIIKVSDDQTVFCWQDNPHHRQRIPRDWASILAPHPAAFQKSTHFFPRPGDSTTPYTITNRGLRISAPLLYTAMGACIILNVGVRTGRRDHLSRVLIRLHRVSSHERRKFVRILSDLMVTQVPPKLLQLHSEVYIDSRNAKSLAVDGLVFSSMGSSKSNLDNCGGQILFLSFNQEIALDKTTIGAVGMEYNHFDSVIEIRHDHGVPGKLSSLCLQSSSMSPGASGFGLIVAARRTKDGQTEWHVQTTPSEDIIWFLEEGPEKHERIRILSEEIEVDGAFRTWRREAPLKSVSSWWYSNGGALVCFMELEVVSNEAQPALDNEDSRFSQLQLYT